MSYQLRKNLSFCRVDDGLIFLDLDADRYFRLADHLERAFLEHLQGSGHCTEGVEALLDRNILTPALDMASALSESRIASPTQSVLEACGSREPPSRSALPEIFAIVCLIRLQLKTRRLTRLLAAIASYRSRAPKTPVALAPDPGPEILRAVHDFKQWRPYVPVDTCCLLDSLSLIVFLARRRLSASLVFGVTNRPFAAHCWVQRGQWVLNDTVGNALAHTPIRVI